MVSPEEFRPDYPSSGESAAAARAPAVSLAHLERDETLTLLHQVSRELTSILAVACEIALIFRSYLTVT